MLRRPPRSTRTDTLFPYTTLFRSIPADMVMTLSAHLHAHVLAPDTKLAMAPTLFSIDQLPRTNADTFALRSEEHTSELQSLMRISYAVFCLKKKKQKRKIAL